MVTALTLLLCCQLAGEVVTRLFRLPFPGPVLGMLLLFVLMLARPRILEAVHEPAQVLLRYLSLLFVPAGVGLMRHGQRLRAELIPIGLAVLISTAVTIGITAAVFEAVARAQAKEKR
jgi:holin-like protein